MTTRVIHDYEFVWMLRGQAHLVTADAQARLVPGHLLLVPPGIEHGFRWDQRRASRHGYVHFQPEADPGVTRPVLRRMTEHDPLSGLCAYLLWLGTAQDPGWEEHASAVVRHLLDLVVGGPLPSDDVNGQLPGPLAAAVDHLRSEWAQPPLHRIDLDELVAAARVSRSYLSRCFAAEFGVSVAAGLERVRCSRAEPLLARTDLPVSEIAEQCGFADLYHFSHRFTRLYGMPPTAYRHAASLAVSALTEPGVRRLAHAIWD